MKLVICLLVSLAALPVWAQFEEVEVKSTALSGTVHMLTGRGGNLAASVGADGIVLVDDQFAPLSEKILNALKQISPEPVRFVINTHVHPDHTGGNEQIGGTGAVIVAHDNVRTRLSVEQFIEFYQYKAPPMSPAGLPVVTFNDRSTLHLNGETVAIHHVAQAHTDGDSIVNFEQSKVLHVGDIYFNGTYPFVDLSNGGSFQGLLVAVDEALSLCGEGYQVIPGHGPLSDCKAFGKYRAMLGVIADRVQSRMAAGETLEQIQQSHPTTEYDEEWGDGNIKPDLLVEHMVRSFSRAQ